MNHLLREISKEIGARANRINHIFGARYTRTVIETEIYFYHAYKYLYRNPAEALMVEKVENYEYSTMQELTGKKKMMFPLHDLNIFPNDLIPLNLKDRTEWLNEPYKQREKLLIRIALKRPIFELPFGKNVAKTVRDLMKIPKR